MLGIESTVSLDTASTNEVFTRQVHFSGTFSSQADESWWYVRMLFIIVALSMSSAVYCLLYESTKRDLCVRWRLGV